MKRIAIVVAVVTGIVAVPAVLANSGSSARPDPYELAHTVSSPLGPLYGPVQAGTSSYGYLAK